MNDIKEKRLKDEQIEKVTGGERESDIVGGNYSQFLNKIDKQQNGIPTEDQADYLKHIYWNSYEYESNFSLLGEIDRSNYFKSLKERAANYLRKLHIYNFSY